jgi:hypothetical protein
VFVTLTDALGNILDASVNTRTFHIGKLKQEPHTTSQSGAAMVPEDKGSALVKSSS